jgi:predicted Zn-dependent protease
LNKNIFSKDRVYQLLSTINQRLRNYRKAFDFLVLAEKESNNYKHGQLVYSFANRALSLEIYDIAILAGDHLSKEGSIFIDQGNLIKAQALEKTKDLKGSYLHFSVASESRQMDIKLKGLIGMARIDLTTDSISACRKKLDQVIKAKHPAFTSEAMLLYVESYLVSGDIEMAKDFLEKNSDELQNQGWYYFTLGELDMFLEKYEDAETLFRLHLARFSTENTGNNSLEYLILLQQKDEAGFDKLIKALSLLKINKKEMALNTFSEISDLSNSLTPVVLWFYSKSLFESLDNSRAMSILNRLSENYPKSFYAPLAFEKMGDIESGSGNQKLAFEHYKKVLMEYPDAINSSIVREKARQSGGS